MKEFYTHNIHLAIHNEVKARTNQERTTPNFESAYLRVLKEILQAIENEEQILFRVSS